MKIRYLFILLCFFVSTFVKAQMSDSAFVAQYGAEQLKDTTSTQRFDYHYYEGIKYILNNEPSKAVDELNVCLSIKPIAAVYYELSRAYLQLNQTKQSFDALKKSTELDASNSTYQELLASYYMAMRKEQSAFDIYERLYKRDRHSVNYLYKLIRIADALEKPNKMLFYLDQLEKLVGLNEDIAYMRMNIYTAQQKPKKIEQELRNLIEKYPYEIYYQVSLGDFYMDQKQEQRALSQYDMVLKKYPHNGYALLSLSNYYRLKNEMDRSDSLLLAAMNDPELPFENKIEKLRPMVVGLVHQNEFAEVDSIFSDLLSTYGDEKQLRQFYLEYLNSRNDTLGLIHEYESLIQSDPENEDNWRELLKLVWKDDSLDKMLQVCRDGYAQFNSVEWGYYQVLAMMLNHQDAAAMVEIDSLMERHPNENAKLSATLYGIKGDYYLTQKNIEQAFLAYDASLSLNFDNSNVLNNYAYYLALENRDLRRAEKMISRALELDPKNVNVLDTYAWVLFMRGDYLTARFYMERALSYDNNGVMYNHYGDILFKVGDEEKAVEMWRKAAEMGETSEVLQQKIATKKYIPETNE